MKSDLPKRFKEGDELTASLINDILEELWRWRESDAVPPLHLSEADSDCPPVWSFSASAIEGQFVPGTTGTGFSSGTPASPGVPNSTVTIYPLEVATGWPSANAITVDNSTGPPFAYNVYAHTVATTLTAWYWKSPSTGNYYIITADCT